MNTSKILEKYAKFFYPIKNYGDVPLNENSTIQELAMTRAMLQMGYKGMKEENFKGDILDYLCWISTQYILIEWAKRMEDGLDALLIVWHFNQGVFRNMIRLFDKNPGYVFETDIFKRFGGKWQLGELISAVRLSELYPDEFPGDLKGIKAMLKI